MKHVDLFYLDSDTSNPSPDRRMRDCFSAQPTWYAGFYVRLNIHDMILPVSARNSHGGVRAHTPGFNLLETCLRPATPEEVNQHALELWKWNYNDYSLLEDVIARLLDAGKISVEDLYTEAEAVLELEV